MKVDRRCQHCDQLFLLIEGKVFANHVRWCHKNTSNGDKGKLSISLASKKFTFKRKGELKQFNVVCQKCKQPFIVVEHEKCHPIKRLYFCSRTCANNHGPVSAAQKKIVSEKLSKPARTAICQNELCKLSFITKSKTKRFCTIKCGQVNRYKDLDQTTYKRYRQRCNFTFGLKTYPDEFDFSLIEKHGWYKAKNHGDNPGGISRDHMFSVKEAFKRQFDPNIIAHPANCQLIFQSENASKSDECSISFDDLLERIKTWDQKYCS